ncbi:MAG: hypothetical protein PHC97_01015 [Patescibacteria group bacterium]|nr:hypothetical protein [Patescibacteria group bacterium]
MESENKTYELWFRLAYKKLIEAKKLKVALRPGARKCPAPKCANENEEAVIKIIITPGNEEKKILPVFDDFQAKVLIYKIISKPIKELSEADLKDCSPDCQKPGLVKYNLALIYNKEFNDDDIVSLVYFEYL